MKSVYLVLLNLLLFFSHTTIAQFPNLQWEKYSQFRGTDFYSDVLEDINKGYTVLGARSVPGNSLDFEVIRFSENGDKLWSKLLGTENKDVPEKIIQLSDDSYVLMGTTQTADTIKLILIKTDEKGDELWRKIFNENEHLVAEDIIALDNGNFVLAGTKGANLQNTKPWMGTLNSSGEIIGEKTFDDFNGTINSIKKIPDGGFALAGNVGEAGNKDCDMVILRTDEAGEITWSSEINSPNQKVWPECICCSPDSCFMVVGWLGKCLNDINSEYAVFDFDLLINKIDCKGKVVWTKNFDKEGSEGGNAIIIRPDGSLIVAGVKVTSFLGEVGPWLLHIDAEGNTLSEKLLKMQLHQASKVINCSDGGFIVIGPGMHE
ncbi:MAG: hypothetical protein ABFS16_11950, partial [Bacteroidota bacterium]